MLYDFYHHKIPFIVCKFSHTRDFEFCLPGCWFFILLSLLYFSVQTFALLESQHTNNKREKEKKLMQEWKKKTNKFHLNFCSLCCGLLFTLLFGQTIHSFYSCCSFSVPLMIEKGSPLITVHALGRTSIHLSHSFISLYIFHYTRSGDARSFYCFLRILKLFQIPSIHNKPRDEKTINLCIHSRNKQGKVKTTHTLAVSTNLPIMPFNALLWIPNKKFETNSFKSFFFILLFFLSLVKYKTNSKWITKHYLRNVSRNDVCDECTKGDDVNQQVTQNFLLSRKRRCGSMILYKTRKFSVNVSLKDKARRVEMGHVDRRKFPNDEKKIFQRIVLVEVQLRMWFLGGISVGMIYKLCHFLMQDVKTEFWIFRHEVKLPFFWSKAQIYPTISCSNLRLSARCLNWFEAF